MKIESQVCTLEQAKRLKELGVEQNTFWEYANEKIKMAFTFNKGERYSAFTVAELGAMLPNTLYDSNNEMDYHLKAWLNDYDYYLYYTSAKIDNRPDIDDNKGEYKTEAEARAAMLIYLLENNLITAEEINKRFERA